MNLIESKTLKFSVSGLRGIYGKDITPENIPLFCMAFNKTLPKGSVAIARDTRNTGEAMIRLVTGSLISLGREVVEIGILPTPTLKAYVYQKCMAGGIMISASHNPLEYNALKFIKKDGYFFNEKDNQKLLSELNSNKRQQTDWSVKRFGLSREDHQEALDAHMEDILKVVHLPKKVKMKAAIDTLGACGTEIAEAFLKKLGPHCILSLSKISEFISKKARTNRKCLTFIICFC